MPNNDFLSQVQQFRTASLKRVSTKITKKDGQQYVETLLDSGGYSLQKSGFSEGYVIDHKADITVALIVDGLILGEYNLLFVILIFNTFEISLVNPVIP